MSKTSSCWLQPRERTRTSHWHLKQLFNMMMLRITPPWPQNMIIGGSLALKNYIYVYMYICIYTFIFQRDKQKRELLPCAKVKLLNEGKIKSSYNWFCYLVLMCHYTLKLLCSFEQKFIYATRRWLSDGARFWIEHLSPYQDIYSKYWGSLKTQGWSRLLVLLGKLPLDHWYNACDINLYDYDQSYET